MPLPDLDILVAVLETGSLTAAATSLEMPRATLTRRLQQLEEEMGTRLVHRSTRRLVPTEAGEALYGHARSIVAAVQAAQDAVRAQDDVPRGLLRVSVPGTQPEIQRMLTAFLVAHPEVQLELLSTTRHVDLVADHVDVALRAGQLTGSGLVSRRLARIRTVAVASPAWLAAHGAPASPEALADLPCLVDFERGEHPRTHWPLWSGGQVPIRARLASNDLLLLSHAAVEGLGVALLPDQFIARELANGELVAILTDEVGTEGGAWLVFAERRLMLPRVRAFIDHVVAWSEKTPLLTVRSDRC